MNRSNPRPSRHGRGSTALAWAAIGALLLAVLLAGCGGLPGRAGSAPTTPASRPTLPIPTPTPFSIGSGEPAPLRESIALLRRLDDGAPAGAAVVVTSEGFLVTDAAALAAPIEVVLPSGEAARPVIVTRDPASGLTLLKVPGEHLVPVRIGARPPQPGDEVFAAGYDAARGTFAQMGGHLVETTAKSVLRTDIPLLPGFSGGALSDSSGAVLGLITSTQEGNGSKVVCALSQQRLIGWIHAWQQQVSDLAAGSDAWPALTTPGGLSLRYPDGWSTTHVTGDAGNYHAEIAPSDPDIPLQLSLAIEPAGDDRDPTAFAEHTLAGRKDVTIWGTVHQAGLPGVRAVLNQEGARVDVVYLFDGDRRITLSLTSGLDSSAAPDQYARATAIFEAVLRSLELR